MAWTRQSSIPVRVGLAAISLVLGCSSVVGAADTSDVADGDHNLRMLAACINTVCDHRVARLLEDGQGRLLASGETLADWGLVTPDAAPVWHDAKQFYPLGALPGTQYEIDQAKQRVELVIDAAESFRSSRADARPDAFVTPAAPVPGGFLNYDVLHEITGARDTTGAVVELGGFNRLGTGTTTFLTRETGSERRNVRLNTTWRHDWPGRVETLRLGDTISRPGQWGRAVQFGGIQWGTNFATQPSFITFPLPQIDGETTVPASVELYANDQIRRREQLPPGPFTLTDIPVVTGVNNLRVVVEDVLGRERVLSRSFYASESLLKQGLQDFTYEAGMVRRAFAIRSNDYGRAFAAGTHRLGISDRLTGEVHAELVEEQRTAGLAASWLAAPWLGVASAAVAGSDGRDGQGTLAGIGLNRQGRRWSYGLETTWASRGFRQLGLQPDTPPPARTVSAHLGARVASGVSLSLNYLELERRHDQADSRFLNASLSSRLFENVSLHFSLIRDLEGRDTFASINLAIPLGGRRSAGLSHTRSDDGYATRMQLQKNAPRGSGVGYRLSGEESENGPDRRQATLLARTGFGSYRAEAARSGDDTGYRFNARGGLALLGGQAFASRSIDESFGVVDVGQYPGVRVYHENQLVDVTDDDGSAFIPDMRPFDKNRIRIDTADLPLESSIDNVDTVAVPGYRQGALVEFAATPSRGALITIRLADGQPLPAGATVRIIGGEKAFPVARYGQAWVTGLHAETRLEAQWNGRSCTFEVRRPEDAGPMPRIGPVTCQERQ